MGGSDETGWRDQRHTPMFGCTAVQVWTFTHFGAPVHLNPPSASKTADITGAVLQHVKFGTG